MSGNEVLDFLFTVFGNDLQDSLPLSTTANSAPGGSLSAGHPESAFPSTPSITPTSSYPSSAIETPLSSQASPSSAMVSTSSSSISQKSSPIQHLFSGLRVAEIGDDAVTAMRILGYVKTGKMSRTVTRCYADLLQIAKVNYGIDRCTQCISAQGQSDTRAQVEMLKSPSGMQWVLPFFGCKRATDGRYADGLGICLECRLRGGKCSLLGWAGLYMKGLQKAEREAGGKAGTSIQGGKQEVVEGIGASMSSSGSSALHIPAESDGRIRQDASSECRPAKRRRVELMQAEPAALPFFYAPPQSCHPAPDLREGSSVLQITAERGEWNGHDANSESRPAKRRSVELMQAEPAALPCFYASPQLCHPAPDLREGSSVLQITAERGEWNGHDANSESRPAKRRSVELMQAEPAALPCFYASPQLCHPAPDMRDGPDNGYSNGNGIAGETTDRLQARSRRSDDDGFTLADHSHRRVQFGGVEVFTPVTTIQAPPFARPLFSCAPLGQPSDIFAGTGTPKPIGAFLGMWAEGDGGASARGFGAAATTNSLQGRITAPPNPAFPVGSQGGSQLGSRQDFNMIPSYNSSAVVDLRSSMVVDGTTATVAGATSQSSTSSTGTAAAMETSGNGNLPPQHRSRLGVQAQSFDSLTMTFTVIKALSCHLGNTIRAAIPTSAASGTHASLLHVLATSSQVEMWSILGPSGDPLERDRLCNGLMAGVAQLNGWERIMAEGTQGEDRVRSRGGADMKEIIAIIQALYMHMREL